MNAKQHWWCAGCEQQNWIVVDIDESFICRNCLRLKRWQYGWFPKPIGDAQPLSWPIGSTLIWIGELWREDSSEPTAGPLQSPSSKETDESNPPSHRKHRWGRWTAFGVAFVLAVMAVAEWSGLRERLSSDEVRSLFVETPIIRLNPEENAPLVALVEFATHRPTMATIEIDDGVEPWTFVEDGPPQTDHRVVLWGIKPDRKHQIRVWVTTPDREVSQQSEPVFLQTPPLPADFPPLKTLISESERMEPGVTIFAANRWEDGKRIHNYGYIIAVDASGEVVWYFRSRLRTSDLRMMSNGHLLYNGAKFYGLYEVDLLGRKKRQWWASGLVAPPNESFIPVSVDSLHHEILELPDGNFLALSTELRRITDFPTRETEPLEQTAEAAVVGDVVVEFQPDGTIVNQISLLDLLDPRRIGYGSLSGFWSSHYAKADDQPSRDWTHANSLDYDIATDEIIVSVRHQDCIVKIDRKSGELVWILGSPSGWRDPWRNKLLRPKSNIQWPFHQHGVEWTPRDTLLMYDNGNYAALPPDPKRPAAENASRVVEFRVNDNARTVEQVWEYGREAERFYSPFYCEADALPVTGNVLVTDGGRIETDDRTPSDDIPADYQWARIFEVTHTEPAEKVFEMTVDSGPSSLTGWSIYRSERLPDRHIVSKIATANWTP